MSWVNNICAAVSFKELPYLRQADGHVAYRLSGDDLCKQMKVTEGYFFESSPFCTTTMHYIHA